MRLLTRLFQRFFRKPHTFGAYYRYGEQLLYNDSDDPERVAQRLLAELRREEFDEPDDEHTSVSIFRGDWSISVSVFGRVTFQNLSWISEIDSDNPVNSKDPVEDSYMRDVPDETLVAIMADLARGNIDRVRDANWLTGDELPPFIAPFYRA